MSDPAFARDPAAWAAALAAATPPGGMAVVETADAGHWRRPALPPPGAHFAFTAKSLTWLMERHGMRVASRRLRWRPVLRVVLRRSI
ncbi:MAG TPA: hypothetical protein VEY95_09825 [Azospirillaceae bacterium]|nr:hypothetical protein [Azospirillaceae bacterium]